MRDLSQLREHSDRVVDATEVSNRCADRPLASNRGRALVSPQGLLDEKGLLEIGFDARAYEDELDSKFIIEVSVTDASRPSTRLRP